MALSFPRSLRALGNDRFRPSLVTLALTILFLLAWFAWFFFAQIPISETSTNFRVGRNGSVSVTLPAATLPRLQAGQKATLQINAAGQANTNFQGQVLRANPTSAELYFAALAQVPANAQGTVQIEIETTTPAALLLQAVRQSATALNAPVPAKTVTPAP